MLPLVDYKRGYGITTMYLSKLSVRWIGHVHRMGRERLPRQLLYSQLEMGQRNQGRPRLRFKDVTKRNLKWRDIKTHDWQSKALHRHRGQSFNRKHRTVIVVDQRTANDDDFTVILDM